MALVALALALLCGEAFGQVPAAAERYRYLITVSALEVFGRQAPIATVAGQLQQESGFRVRVVSGKGAGGIAQFTAATAASMGRLYPQLRPVDRFNPIWSIRAQHYLLRDLLAAVRGFDACEAWAFALAGYNGGPRWVRARVAMSSSPLFCLYATCDINPGILASNQVENQEYPRRILLRLEPLYMRAWGARGVCH